MSRSPLFAGRSRQRGAVMLFAAMGISALIISASLLDLGLLYQYRREYQKTADLAALAGAQNLFNGCAAATATANTSATRNLGGRNFNTPDIACGRWRPSPTPFFDGSVPAEEQRAVQVTISGSPPGLLPGMPSRTLSATAVAITDQPVAALTARSTLATVDTSQSPLLNSVVGGLLGGSINLPVAAWNGLLDTNINLLSYAEALALRLGISVGNQAALLASEVTVGELLDVALDILPPGSTADLALNGLLNASLPGLNDTIRIGDLLSLAPGLDTSGLNADLNLFQLVQATVQLAGQDRVVEADLLGIASVRIKILEPTQISAIGNPEFVNPSDPLGVGSIFVRTAQVRTLISIELPIVGGVLDALELLLNSALISSITSIVNNVLTLNLMGLLEQLLSLCLLVCNVQGDVVDIQILETPRIDINIDAGGGQAYVVDHACDGDKMLEVDTRTAAATLRIGKMGTSAANAAVNVFASSAPPVVEAVPLIDIGTYRARRQCLAVVLGIQVGCSTTWRDSAGNWTANKNLAQRTEFSGGGIGIRLGGFEVGGTSGTVFYEQSASGGLPDVGEEPAWHEISSTGIVGALSNSLNNLGIQFYPASGAGSGLGNVLALVGGVANLLISTLSGIINAALSPLLDPLIDLLLGALGVNLNKVEIGANLTCDGGGATLVQ